MSPKRPQPPKARWEPATYWSNRNTSERLQQARERREKAKSSGNPVGFRER